MHLTQVAQVVVAGSWQSIPARCSSFAIGSRTMRRAGSISPGCGGRKGSAARCAGAGSLGHGAGVASLPGVRSADFGDGRDLVRGHALTLASVVRSALARDQPEKRGQRTGPAAGVGAGELSDGVEFAAQAAPGNGSPGT